MKLRVSAATLDALRRLQHLPDDLAGRIGGVERDVAGSCWLRLTDDEAMALCELLQWHVRTDPATGQVTADTAPYADLIQRIGDEQF